MVHNLKVVSVEVLDHREARRQAFMACCVSRAPGQFAQPLDRLT